jgi:hypothetical protein
LAGVVVVLVVVAAVPCSVAATTKASNKTGCPPLRVE